jgi:AhpD family alkylhydroperoxidase
VGPSRYPAALSRYDDFQAFRTRLNQRILGEEANHTGAAGQGAAGGTLNIKRFFALDSACYKAGALDVRTKELMGLTASMVLRCDDCIAYHIDQCLKSGVSEAELWEVFDVALIVGGSIVIPHLRRAVAFMDEARARMPA